VADQAKDQAKDQPKNGIIEIDHLLTAVQDAQRAGEDFERLGFTVTPLSVITAMGLSNRLVLLSPLSDGAANFVELMALNDPAAANAAMRQLLEGPESVRSMVMTSRDAETTRSALIAEGYEPGEVHKLQRVWELPSGEQLHLAFDVLLPLPAPFAFNVCQYRTLQHYLRPQWREHPNGAVSLVSVHCVEEQPRKAIGYFEKLFGKRAERESDGSLSITPGKVKLVVHAPAQFAAAFGIEPPRPGGYAGYSINVEDLGRTTALLRARGIDFVDLGAAGAVVGPAAAHGNALRFVG
jgi:hypothetical protein